MSKVVNIILILKINTNFPQFARNILFDCLTDLTVKDQD